MQLEDNISHNVPILSIVIPVFNRQVGLNSLLTILLESISREKLEDRVEVIVIDDYSNPPVLLKQQLLEIQIIRNSKNLGAPLSREKGFQLSKGKFVHFHDSDDSISESWLSDVISELKSKPSLDVLLTGRIDVDGEGDTFRRQKYFHKHVLNRKKIQSRLIYRNCMGPLGGVIFSRKVLEGIRFKPFLSCQDWQMYIDVMKTAKVLSSRPDIHFIFNKTGDDRISNNVKKKLLGHSQLARITSPKSPFGKSLRLFYLYTCKQHVLDKGGNILRFYKKNRLKIILTYFLVSIYWRLR